VEEVAGAEGAVEAATRWAAVEKAEEARRMLVPR